MNVISGLVLGAGGILYPREADFPEDYFGRLSYIDINMAINVYEYGRGGKCAYKLTYIYAWITQMEVQMEEEERHMSKVMCTSIGTVT